MFTAAKIAAGMVTAVAVLGLAGSMLVLAPAAPYAAAAAVPAHAAIAPSAAPATARHLSRPTHLSRATAAVTFAPGSLVNLNSQLCLGISGGRDDAPAVQWTCNGHKDQIWHLGSPYTPGSSWNQLVNDDGECLGVANSSAANGAKLVGWTCLGHPDQYWQVLPYFCGPYLPYENLNSGEVVSVASNSTKAGAAVVQWPLQAPCKGQNWDYF